MTEHRGGGLILSADLSGAGTFDITVALVQPSIPLQAALKDLQAGLSADPEDFAVLLHAVASRIAGFCLIKDAAARAALDTTWREGIVLDWRFAMRSAGKLTALFAVGRLTAQSLTQQDLFDISLRLASLPSFAADKANTTAFR